MSQPHITIQVQTIEIMKLWLNTFILWVKSKHLKRKEKKMAVERRGEII